jgi:hypothetical protein
MILETLCLDSAGLERRTGWSVGSREDFCERERGVPLPEDRE